MTYTIYAVLSDEELIRFAETKTDKTALEAEFLLRLRSRVDHQEETQEED